MECKKGGEEHGVVFDAFGTLVKIDRASHPYRQLLKLGIMRGRKPRHDDVSAIMSNHWSLEVAACELGIAIKCHELEALQSCLDDELSSITAYPDGLDAVAMLKCAGFRVGVCSNLALPYAPALMGLYPSLDAMSFSFEVGALKPDVRIYQDVCAKLGVDPGSVTMIGDSQKCDSIGPREFGMGGWHLDRSPGAPLSELTSFAGIMIKKFKI